MKNRPCKNCFCAEECSDKCDQLIAWEFNKEWEEIWIDGKASINYLKMMGE